MRYIQNKKTPKKFLDKKSPQNKSEKIFERYNNSEINKNNTKMKIPETTYLGIIQGTTKRKRETTDSVEKLKINF